MSLQEQHDTIFSDLLNLSYDIKCYESTSNAWMDEICPSPTLSSEGTYSSVSDDNDIDYNPYDDELVIKTEDEKPKKRSRKTKNGEKGLAAGERKEMRVRRNERERRRVRRLADGFTKLRTLVPGDHKKRSKLDTLKQAMEYINGLASMLVSHDVEQMKNEKKVTERSYTKEKHQIPSPTHVPDHIEKLQLPTIQWMYTPIQYHTTNQYPFVVDHMRNYQANLMQ